MRSGKRSRTSARSSTKRPQGAEYQFERGPCDLARVSFGDPEHNPNPTEVCVYRPGCSPFWSVWVANSRDGWMTLLTRLCGRHRWPAVSVRSTGANAPSWIQELKLQQGSAVTRLVRTMWDDRPDFYTSGSPLFFEETELYGARAVKARLTRDALGRYLTRLGVPVSLPGFWASGEDAVYFRRGRSAPAGG